MKTSKKTGLKISNGGNMVVKAPKPAAPEKKPTVIKGGDLRSK